MTVIRFLTVTLLRVRKIQSVLCFSFFCPSALLNTAEEVDLILRGEEASGDGVSLDPGGF